MNERNKNQGAFPDSEHDHASCRRSALHRAEAICTDRGLRLTAQRRRVLELVWENHAPIGAYDVLERLNVGGGRNAPSVVYRALDFLMAQGFVHRIASLNAYVGCECPGAPHTAQFLICRLCGTVAELHDPRIGRAIRRGAGEVGFEVESTVVEVKGICPGCGEEGGAGD